MDDAFVAEAAPNIGRDYTDTPLLEAEALGQAGAHDVRELRGTVHRELIHTAVPERNHPFTLHRYGRLTVHPELALDHDRSLRRNRIEFTAVGESLEYDIVAPLLMQQRRARLQGLEHIRHHAQVLIVERNIPREVFGLGTSVSHAHGHQFANEPDLPKREDRIVGDLIAGELGYRPDWFDSLQEVADEHGPGRPWRHLDRSNPCVCHPASDKGNILHPRKLDIGNEIAAAVEMAVVLFSRKPG